MRQLLDSMIPCNTLLPTIRLEWYHRLLDSMTVTLCDMILHVCLMRQVRIGAPCLRYCHRHRHWVDIETSMSTVIAQTWWFCVSSNEVGLSYSPFSAVIIHSLIQLILWKMSSHSQMVLVLNVNHWSWKYVTCKQDYSELRVKKYSWILPKIRHAIQLHYCYSFRHSIAQCPVMCRHSC